MRAVFGIQPPSGEPEWWWSPPLELRALASGTRAEDPPMKPRVLDEAVNICPITDLPGLCRDYGSRAVLLTDLPSDQAVRAWGRARWDVNSAGADTEGES